MVKKIGQTVLLFSNCLLERSRTLRYNLVLSLGSIILVALRKRYYIIASS